LINNFAREISLRLILKHSVGLALAHSLSTILSMRLKGNYMACVFRLLSMFVATFPFYGHSETLSETAEFNTLSCQLSQALRGAYSSPGDFDQRQESFERALTTYSSLKPNEKKDSFVYRGKFYEKMQELYHKIFGYEGFYAYAAMIPNAKTSYESFLGKYFIMSSIQKTEMQAAAKNGRLTPAFIDELWQGNDNAVRASNFSKILSSNISGSILEPVLFGLGPTADQLAIWLLAHPERSVTYSDLFAKALELTNGEPVTALGVVSGVFAFDASFRGKLGTLMTDRLELPKALDSFHDRAGVNYHFWCYLALAMVQSPAKLRVLSFGYETLLQKDYAEASSDQIAVTTANISMFKYVNSRAFSSCGLADINDHTSAARGSQIKFSNPATAPTHSTMVR
jgi:hypothetical protein